MVQGVLQGSLIFVSGSAVIVAVVCTVYLISWMYDRFSGSAGSLLTPEELEQRRVATALVRGAGLAGMLPEEQSRVLRHYFEESSHPYAKVDDAEAQRKRTKETISKVEKVTHKEDRDTGPEVESPEESIDKEAIAQTVPKAHWERSPEAVDIELGSKIGTEYIESDAGEESTRNSRVDDQPTESVEEVVPKSAMDPDTDNGTGCIEVATEESEVGLEAGDQPNESTDETFQADIETGRQNNSRCLEVDSDHAETTLEVEHPSNLSVEESTRVSVNKEEGTKVPDIEDDRENGADSIDSAPGEAEVAEGTVPQIEQQTSLQGESLEGNSGDASLPDRSSSHSISSLPKQDDETISRTSNKDKYQISASDNHSHDERSSSSGSDAEDEEEGVCPICLSEYDDGDKIVIGSSCGHMYHFDCFMQWMEKKQNECPFCRTDMMTSDEFLATAYDVLGEQRVNKLKNINEEAARRLAAWHAKNAPEAAPAAAPASQPPSAEIAVGPGGEDCA